MRIGIVGLPNVGKSTLFNALTKQSAEAANFPFTTINPNIGIVAVPDERLDKLAQLSQSAKITPTAIEFVDIAGLVKNAHQGEGLGNKFLSHIREVDALAHVVRIFPDPNITHVGGQVNPLADVETIETELALADLTTLEKILARVSDLAKSQDQEALTQLPVLEKIRTQLEIGSQARHIHLEPKQSGYLHQFPLLTTKPVIYVANVGEDQIAKADKLLAPLQKKLGDNASILALSVKIEQELISLSDADRTVFLQEYGLAETGLNRLIKAGYKILDLITFLTTGPTESRAWTVSAGSLAPHAAGQIHSDMEQGFIRAETVAYTDLIQAGSLAAARAAGKVRDEGKEYLVKDGDVMLFKFSAPAK